MLIITLIFLMGNVRFSDHQASVPSSPCSSLGMKNTETLSPYTDPRPPANFSWWVSPGLGTKSPLTDSAFQVSIA